MNGVLVVEDDEDIRDALVDIISCEDYPVEGVKNGKEAIEYLKANPAPCLILLDLTMPVMSGGEFRKVQLENPAWASIPVCVLTAATDRAQNVEALKPSAFLKKPLNLDKLIEVIQKFC